MSHGAAYREDAVSDVALRNKSYEVYMIVGVAIFLSVMSQ